MSDASGFQTNTFSVSQLLDAIRKGQVRVPLFQRSFVWTDEDRRLLFDSIQSGYPIGTLLLARGRGPASTLRLGEYSAEVSEAPDALWVVDGQQRLSTLAMSLLGEHTGAYRPLYFDLGANGFVIGPRRHAAAPQWVPTRVLGSSATLNRWLREANLSDELNDRADLVAGRIRDYVVPAYVVPYRGPDDQVPREIFARVNRRGRALKSHEVFEALNVSATGVKPLQGVRATLAALGFGSLEGNVIERAAIAVEGSVPGRHLDDIVKGDAVAALLDRVTRGLSAAITFVANETGVPHIDLLPYDGVLPTLARFFDHHPQPHPRNLELMGRWFWRGMLTGDHRTDNGIDGRKWPAIDGNEHASVQRLLRLLPPVSEAQRDGALKPYRRGTARSNVELLAACALQPRVLLGEEQGAEVPVASLLTEDGKNFPTPVADRRASQERTLATFLAHGPVSYDDLREAEPGGELLVTHAIDRAAWEAFTRNDWPTFIDRRTAILEHHLSSFLAARAGLDVTDHDREPLESYFLDESA